MEAVADRPGRQASLAPAAERQTRWADRKMTKLSLGLFLSIVVGLISCQVPPDNRMDDSFEINAYTTLVDVRYLTRAIPPKVCERCNPPSRAGGIFSDCVSEGTSDCQCGLYSENDLRDLILKELNSSRNAELESVSIENGLLILYGDDWSVKKVTRTLEALSQNGE